MRFTFAITLLLMLCFLFPVSLSAQDRLYWANNTTGILSANKDGSDLDTLINTLEREFSSLSLDTVNKNVYWLDSYRRQFGRMNYDGTDQEPLFIPDGQEPLTFFFEPIERKLYWYDKVTDSFWKANPNGAQRESVSGPVGGNAEAEFVVDQTNELLYWRNTVDDRIQSINLNDQSVQDVVINGPESFIIDFRLDLIHQKIYWLTVNLGYYKEIKRSNLDGTEEEFVFTFQYDQFNFEQEFELDPIGNRLMIVHQPAFDLGEQLLIGKLDGSDMEIRAFFTTNNTEHLRFDYQSEDLFYAGENAYGIYTLHFDGSTAEGNRIAIGTSPAPRGIAVDHLNEKVYWTDNTNDMIQRSNLDGSDVEVLIESIFNKRLVAPGAIALDVANNYMYWVDIGRGEISRAHLDGSEDEIILGDLWNPQGLALDTTQSKMYFTTQGATGIYRANMDGSGQERIIELVNAASDGFANQVALDLENRHLYWSSPGLGLLRSNLDGTNIDTVWHTSYTKGSGIALDVSHQKIYWIVDSTLQCINFEGSEKRDLIGNLRIAGNDGGYLTLNDTHAYLANPNSSLGLWEAFTTAELTVFPNPADELLRINWELQQSDDIRIDLYSISGKWVKSLLDTQFFQQGRQLIEVDLHGLNSGIYLVVLRTDKMQISRKISIN